MKIMYVNDMTTLTVIDRIIMYISMVCLNIQTPYELCKEIDKIFRQYNKYVFLIKYVYLYMDFKSLMEVVKN